LVNGEPTKKVAVKARPTPTSSRLMRFKIVSLTRVTAPSLRSLRSYGSIATHCIQKAGDY
jgi:hypothetical protein